jgi:hypothetical protein
MKQVAIGLGIVAGLLTLFAANYAAFDYATHITVAGVAIAAACDLGVVVLALMAYMDLNR